MGIAHRLAPATPWLAPAPHSLVFALALALLACNGSPSHTDAGGTDADPGDADASSMDAAPLDTPSGVTSALCASAVDLNATGTLSGDTTTVHGSTETPTDVIAGPCNPALTGHQVYRYRVRGANVWLRATTNLPGTTPGLDTTVWVLTSPCSENSTVLACNDDDPNTPDALAGTSTLATPSLTGGTEVFIVVAGYARAHRGALARGAFDLAVTELPSAMPGATCDSSVPGGCVHGFECAATSLMAGVCVQPGMETEPNNTPAMAQQLGMLTGPLAVHAALEPAGDVDCFAFAIAQGTSLHLEANDGGGSCTADLRADLYRAGEMDPFDGDDDSGRATDVACPLIDPSDHEDVRNMPAGTYVFCVRASEPTDAPPMITTDHYSVQISPVQP